jgi:thymidylate synthase (FAD)
MKVQLIEHTKLSNACKAGRTCWDSFHKGGCYTSPTNNISEEDKDFLNRIINKNKHGSIAEHLVYTFDIDGISRACLQELARHRMASLSVKSTRYVLAKELANEEPFMVYMIDNKLKQRASKYIVLTGDDEIDIQSIKALENLRQLVVSGKSNDVAKYCLPEAFKTSLVWTINARSLQNFLSLRTSKSALWEIRDLAQAIYNNLPEEHKYLYKEYMYELQ